MRISNLSERAGLPVGTVKFYLRTGLLHSGRATSATQAVYDEHHLQRLRLIRAMLEVGRLSHAEIQRVLDAMEEPGPDTEATLATVEEAVALRFDGDEDTDVTLAHELVTEFGWTVAPTSPHLPVLARALEALAGLGMPVPRERMKVYAEAAAHVARSDIQQVLDADPADQPLVAATEAVLLEPVLSALRRLAAENQAARAKSPVPAPRLSVTGV